MIPAPLPPEVWEGEGARIADRVTGTSAVIIVGREPEVTALVARGLARVASAERPVAIADLIGGVPTLTVAHEVPGVRECFRDGDPVSAIAQELAGFTQVFVLPQGVARLDAYALARHPRWRPLIAGFRRTEGLLLIVALAGTDGIDALIAATDGVVAVDLPPVVLRQWPLVAMVDRPEELPPIVVSETARAHLAARLEAETASPVSSAPPPARWGAHGTGRRRIAGIAGALLLAAGARLLTRPPTPTDSGRETGALALLPPPAPTIDPTIPVDTITLGPVVNPLDSAKAAVYAVQLVAANSPAGANSSLATGAGTPLPAATIAPVQLDRDGRTWYRAMVGAWRDREDADRFLAGLRREAVVGAGSGRVVRAPYALQLAEGVAAAEVPAALVRWQRLGVSAYGLLQDDGRVRLLAGAFETPGQAAVLAVSLRDAGVPPALVFRIGRTF